MRVLVDLLHAERRTVRLCAPTGKAARRLAEITGAQATTIHRLLEYSPGEGFARGAEDPIPGTDVLIVDEASMLSVRLAEALFAAVGPRTHVLLVGDVDQLAPVGPGRVLDDLIESGRVPVVRLTDIFRQAARSLIVRAAHAVNAGQPPPTVAGPGDLRDFFVIERTAPTPSATRSSRSPPSACRPTTTSTRAPRSSSWPRCTAGRRASTRSTPSCAPA